jgi:hypothetical protein
MKGFLGLVSSFFPAAILPCTASSAPLHAQQKNFAIISGTVQDPVGGAVQNATVVVRSESGAETKSTTDAAGKFSIPGLPAAPIPSKYQPLDLRLPPGKACRQQPIAR